ncbi:Cap15 family cyclic dinucleotide receptor domain-containing protein [Metapseudomonas otitidis]
MVFFAVKLFGMHAWRVPGLAYLLNNYVGPDLRGDWKSSVKYTGDDGQIKSKELSFVIKMSVFDFSMTMNSEDGYSSSHVVSSKLLRDELLGGFVLYYVFESEVSNPVSKDVGSFQGAAKLRVNSSGPLKGVYWTNRNWQNRLQTAGHVELTRM